MDMRNHCFQMAVDAGIPSTARLWRGSAPWAPPGCSFNNGCRLADTPREGPYPTSFADLGCGDTNPQVVYNSRAKGDGGSKLFPNGTDDRIRTTSVSEQSVNEKHFDYAKGEWTEETERNNGINARGKHGINAGIVRYVQICYYFGS